MSARTRRIVTVAVGVAVGITGLAVATCKSSIRRSDDGTTVSGVESQRSVSGATRRGTNDAAVVADAPGGAGEHSRNSGSLRGRVSRVDGRAPMGVRIHATPVSRLPGVPDTRTPSSAKGDDSGAFEFAALAAGDWELLCNADSARGVRVGVVRVPDVARIDFLLPVGTTYRGTLVDDVTGAPIAGAKLENGNAETTTAVDGSFVVDTHRPDGGNSSFGIVAPGYRRRPVGERSMSDVVSESPPGGTYTLELRACRGATVRGVVTGPDGPVAGVDVDLTWNWWSEYLVHTTTDERGRYAFEHVDDGTTVVRIRATGLVPTDPESMRVEAGLQEASDACLIEVPDDGEIVHDVALVRPSFRRVRGRVLDSGKPVAGARVASVFHEQRVETTSAADGSFDLAGVIACGAASALSVSCDGFAPATESIDTPASDPVEDVEIELFPLPRVRGRIADEAAAPVPSVRVFVVSYSWRGDLLAPDGEHHTTSEARVDPDGRYSASFPKDAGWIAVIATAPSRATATEIRERAQKTQTLDDTVDVVLHGATTLTGRVVRTGTDEPAESVLITDVAALQTVVTPKADADFTQEDAARVVATTGADGAFRVEGIGFSGPGWISRTVDLDVSSTPVRIEIDHERSIAGRLELDDGTPARGVVVVAYGGPPTAPTTCPKGRAWPVTSDADGRFEIRGLPPGEYRLDVANERRGICWAPVERGATEIAAMIVGPFVAGDGGERVIRVVRGLSITGRVVDPDGTSIGGFGITATPDDKAALVGETFVDETGAFQLGGLVSGTYVIRVTENPFALTEVSGVRAGGDPIVVKLGRGLAIEGVLLDADGKPIADGTVSAEPLVGDNSIEFHRWASSDATGHVRITGLTRGRWRLKAPYPETFPADLILDAGAKDVVLRCVARTGQDH
jgi:hypothetical protein